VRDARDEGMRRMLGGLLQQLQQAVGWLQATAAYDVNKPATVTQPLCTRI